jgi:hypothetical protein
MGGSRPVKTKKARDRPIFKPGSSLDSFALIFRHSNLWAAL